MAHHRKTDPSTRSGVACAAALHVGGLARLGDPFDVNGDYGAGISFSETAVVATPEPQSIVLLATGLALVGIAGSARTFRRNASWH